MSSINDYRSTEFPTSIIPEIQHEDQKKAGLEHIFRDSEIMPKANGPVWEGVIKYSQDTLVIGDMRPAIMRCA